MPIYRFVELTAQDDRAIYEMLQGIEALENGFTNEVKDMSYALFPGWLALQAGYAQGKGLPEGWVPQRTYWLFCDGVPVGCGRIRHPIDEALRESAGHIGYAIACPYRVQGHGSALFGLLVAQCRVLGVHTIYVRVNRENYASSKIVLRCGAMLRRQSAEKNFYTIPPQQRDPMEESNR